MGRSTVALALGSIVVVSTLALLGFFTFGWSQEQLRRRLPFMIATGIGVLVGEAFFHLIPEALQLSHNPKFTLGLVGAGVGVSYLIETALRVGLSKSRIAPVGRLSLLSEAVHNAVDGSIIAGAYLIGPGPGLIATLAVICHEIPHELSNFAVLVHSNYSRSRALKLNFLSACAAIAGGVATLWLGAWIGDIRAAILPLAAGSFAYIALVDLLPDLWKSERDTKVRLLGSVPVMAGLLLMMLLRGA